MPNVKDEIDWTVIAKDEYWEKFKDPKVFPQELLNVSDETLSKYYESANELFVEKNFADAQDAFMFLTFLNPLYPTFWMGFGASAQSQGDFSTAVMAYQALEFLQPDKPDAYANVYQCYTALGDQQNADNYYNKFIEACGNNPEYEQLKQQIEQYKTNVAQAK
jgi:type III secretion system low calcium response chaperone LcrH/SycD